MQVLFLLFLLKILTVNMMLYPSVVLLVKTQNKYDEI